METQAQLFSKIETQGQLLSEIKEDRSPKIGSPEPARPKRAPTKNRLEKVGLVEVSGERPVAHTRGNLAPREFRNRELAPLSWDTEITCPIMSNSQTNEWVSSLIRKLRWFSLFRRAMAASWLQVLIICTFPTQHFQSWVVKEIGKAENIEDKYRVLASEVGDRLRDIAPAEEILWSKGTATANVYSEMNDVTEAGKKLLFRM